MISVEDLKQNINTLSSNNKPFAFILDYEMKRARLIESPFEDKDFLFQTIGYSNFNAKELEKERDIYLKPYPISLETYKEKFNIIQNALKRGDSFLANLTIRTEIETNLSMIEVFLRSKSKYKIYLKDVFTCFSPESFIRIIDNRIMTYPMKGTISADIPFADKIILEDYKEKCEHYTIVDLMRNDLNSVSNNVRVVRNRYLDKIETNKGSIYQVSSEIEGELEKDWRNRLGDIIINLLPAGSISGAPKPSTLKAIEKAEGIERGFYTGVFGYFDGKDFDSCVMIRFVEKDNNKLYFRSGGGITINSDAKDEYEEVLKKIYFPF